MLHTIQRVRWVDQKKKKGINLWWWNNFHGFEINIFKSSIGKNAFFENLQNTDCRAWEFAKNKLAQNITSKNLAQTFWIHFMGTF